MEKPFCNIALLDYLAELTGNRCLSDLRVKFRTPYLHNVVWNVQSGLFSPEAWHETSEYLLEQPIPHCSSCVLRAVLIYCSRRREESHDPSRKYRWEKAEEKSTAVVCEAGNSL